ncbi:MAG: FAD-dependent oxidoreductase, partial [Planctomycetes bacterium]|nr:FAD-dependent oxidoreductase [Planctomycetota bacterium]
MSDPADGATSSSDRSLAASLRLIVGDAHVVDRPDDLDRAARTTASEGRTPRIIVRPHDRDQVQAIMRLAAVHRIPVYPISGGRNWGYGDACPPTAGQILIDLSRMDRIVSVDATLAYAVIEPGVTQRQLHEHLVAHRLQLWMDCTGAGPDASVLGNIMDRGFGHSRYGDRAAHVCAMEFVLADGEVLETGSPSSNVSARGRHVFAHGLGPDIAG